MDFLLLLLLIAFEKRSTVRQRVQQDGPWLRLLGALERGQAALHPWWALAVLVLAPVLVVALALLALGSLGYGLPAFPLALLVVIYSLGRGDPPAELGPYRDRCRQGDREGAYLAARRDLQIDAPTAEALALQVQRYLLWQSYQGFFAVIFWFVLLGPAVALGYRLVALTATYATQPALAERAAQLQHALDWLPVRLLAASFALVGDFLAVKRQLLAELLSWQVRAEELLLRSARAATAQPPAVDTADPGAEVAALDALWQLLVRAAVLWYAVLALWTLLG